MAGAQEREKVSFEKSLERLEAIVKEMEGGELSLDDLIKRFEEGQKLVAVCGRKLNEVERKIELLVSKGDTVEAQPFEGGVEEGPQPPAGPAAGELF